MRYTSHGWTSLQGVMLAGADLSEVGLQYANLIGADLTGAFLRGATLDDATKLDEKQRLVWSILNEGGAGRDLGEANLRNADLSEADLSDANLRGAGLSSATMPDGTLHEWCGQRWQSWQSIGGGVELAASQRGKLLLAPRHRPCYTPIKGVGRRQAQDPFRVRTDLFH